MSVNYFISDNKVSSFCFSLYLFFILDYFLRFSSRIPGYGSLRPTLVVFALLVFLLVTQKTYLKNKIDDPIFKSIIILIFYIIISLPFVEWPGSVIKNNLQSFIKAIIFLFFTVIIVDTEKRFKIFLSIYIGCQVFRVLEPLYLHVTEGYWGSKTYIGNGEFAQRLGGAPADVINSNELGFVIVTAIPFLYYLLWQGRWYGKFAFVILFPLLIYALALTSSRGAFLALLVVLWHMFKSSQKKGAFVLILFVGVLVTWSNLSDFQKERYLSLFGGDGVQAATAEGRLRGTIGELKLGLEKPIFGHGLGTTPEAKFHIVGKSQASHNLYAELLIELGLIGTVIFFVFLKKIYNRFVNNKTKLLKLKLNRKDFYFRLNMAMTSIFWMYIVYSVNYWGLSQYYWYLFAGMSIVFGFILDSKTLYIQKFALKDNQNFKISKQDERKK